MHTRKETYLITVTALQHNLPEKLHLQVGYHLTHTHTHSYSLTRAPWILKINLTNVLDYTKSCGCVPMRPLFDVTIRD